MQKSKKPFLSKPSAALLLGIVSGFTLLTLLAVVLLKDPSSAEVSILVALICSSISFFLLSTEKKSKKACTTPKTLKS